MNKSDCRTRAKARRDAAVAAMTVAERHAAAVLLAARAFARIGDAAVVAAYLPIGSEIDTLPLIDRLARAGHGLALPHVVGRRGVMRFLAWSPGDVLVPGPMGLLQPDTDAAHVQPDLILTPLLAFDDALDRLGYGAGHYDRALAALPRARRIGLAWAMQHADGSLPRDDWDMPLHAVATELDWIER